VQQRLHADHPGEADRQQLTELVRGTPCDAEPDQHDARVHHDEERDAEQPPLLAHHREDEVVVDLREEAELLPPLAEPDAGEPARPDRDQRLPHLEAGARRVRGGVQERHDALRAKPDPELRAQQRQREQPEEREVRDAAAGGEHDQPAEQRDQARGREVRLEQDRHEQQPPPDQERDEPAREACELALLLHRERGRPHDDGDLRQLGGLEGDRADREPAPGPVHLGRERARARQDHDHEQQHHRGQQRPGAHAPEAVGDACRRPEHEQPGRRAAGLPADVVPVRKILALREEAARRVERDQPERDEHERAHHERGGFPAAADPGFGERQTRARRDVDVTVLGRPRGDQTVPRASSAKRRPRSS
jgi:hypothetical protein